MTTSDTGVADRTGAAVDLRAPDRSDLWADETAPWDRPTLARAGLDESPPSDCLHGHVRKHLAMLGPWCVEHTRPGGPH